MIFTLKYYPVKMNHRYFVRTFCHAFVFRQASLGSRYSSRNIQVMEKLNYYSTRSSNFASHERHPTTSAPSPRESYNRRVRERRIENDGSSVSSIPKRDRHRFVLSPATNDGENFRVFLDCLKYHREIPEWAKTGGGLGGGGAAYKSILYAAPFLADRFGRAEEFADVVAEWFDAVRPLLIGDARRGELTVALAFSPHSNQNAIWKKSVDTMFSIPYQLQYLGRINRITRGRLMENLGWNNVSFLARRMVDCGFLTYTFGEVANAALSGLRDIYQPIFTTESNRLPIDASFYTGGLKVWLLAFAHHLAAAEAKPMDWRLLTNTGGDTKSTIPSILSRLEILRRYAFVDDPDRDGVNAMFAYLTKTLCIYAKLHFDDIVENCAPSHRKGRISFGLYTPRAMRFLNGYVEFWLRNQQESGDGKISRHDNPEYYAIDSWSSFYKACDVSLTQLILVEDMVRDNGQSRKFEADTLLDVERKIIEINRGYISTTETMKILNNTLESACLYNKTSTFYQFLFDTWRKAFQVSCKTNPSSDCR